MKVRILIVVVCAAVAGYFLGRRSSPEVEPRSGGRISPQAMVAGGGQPTAQTHVAESNMAPMAQASRPQTPRTAALDWVEDMKRGDVEAVARSILLTSEARNVIGKAMESAPPEFTRRHPTPELLTAFVFCGAQRIDGFQIETERLVQPDYAVLEIAYKFESEPEWRREGFEFKRTFDGWKNVVGDGLAARIAAIIGAAKR